MGKLRAVIIPGACSVPLPIQPSPYNGGWMSQGDLQRQRPCPPSTKRQRPQLTPSDIARNARIALALRSSNFAVGTSSPGIQSPAEKVVQGVGRGCKINSYQATSTW